MSKRRGYLSPFAGATRFRNLFDSNFYKIGLSKVYVTLQLDQRLDAVWEGEKIWGSFDASLRYRGLNFKIFTVPTELNFLPSGGDRSQIFCIHSKQNFFIWWCYPSPYWSYCVCSSGITLWHDNLTRICKKTSSWPCPSALQHKYRSENNIFSGVGTCPHTLPLIASGSMRICPTVKFGGSGTLGVWGYQVLRFLYCQNFQYIGKEIR